MGLEQSRVYLTSPAPDDDSAVVGEKLTAKQEAFALAWAETNNQAAAYRRVYTVHERTLPNSVWAAASRIAAIPAVRARCKVIQEQAALEAAITIREAFLWQLDIATANPNELTRTVLRNCRYCRGNNHRYQWADDIEYLAATVKALDDEENPPTDEGGYGFSGALEPIATCTHCHGAGIPETLVCDTTKLTGKALKLYAGSKQDRFGCIEILTHDQSAAWERVCRMLGAFKDSLDLRTPEERARGEVAGKLPDNITADAAAKAYLALIS